MIISSNNKNTFVAISYDTATFNDLKQFMLLAGIELSRQEPDEFVNNCKEEINYINLILTDIEQRKFISGFLDEKNLNRFSYIHDTAVISGDVDLGCFIYPCVVLYAGSSVAKDVIMHASCAIGHQCTIGQGSFFSGGVVVGGSTIVGKFNKFMIGVFVHDKVNICDNVTVGTRSVVRKNITVPGVYSALQQFKKIGKR